MPADLPHVVPFPCCTKEVRTKPSRKKYHFERVLNEPTGFDPVSVDFDADALTTGPRKLIYSVLFFGASGKFCPYTGNLTQLLNSGPVLER